MNKSKFVPFSSFVMADLSVDAKFCFMFKRKTSETVLTLKTVDKDIAMRKFKFTSSFLATKKVKCYLMSNIVLRIY